MCIFFFIRVATGIDGEILLDKGIDGVVVLRTFFGGLAACEVDGFGCLEERKDGGNGSGELHDLVVDEMMD